MGAGALWGVGWGGYVGVVLGVCGSLSSSFVALMLTDFTASFLLLLLLPRHYRMLQQASIHAAAWSLWSVLYIHHCSFRQGRREATVEGSGVGGEGGGEGGGATTTTKTFCLRRKEASPQTSLSGEEEEEELSLIHI